MIRNVVVTTSEDTIYSCARKMEFKGISCLVVVEGTQVKGILSEQDIVQRVIAKNLSPYNVTAGEVMSKEVSSISPKSYLQDAIVLMGKKNIRHLPVILSGELVGMISARDIISIEPLLIEVLKFDESEKLLPPRPVYEEDYREESELEYSLDSIED